MKRFHVHLHVTDLDANIRFYSALFDQTPARTETDYAKWMLDDPPVNFAISTRGSKPGVDHLGIQVDATVDLAMLKGRADKAGMTLLDEGETSCCYARSDKYWLTDPQGMAWEQFHTLGSIPLFNEQPAGTPTASACCTPALAPARKPLPIPVAAAACCGPSVTPSTASPDKPCC